MFLGGFLTVSLMVQVFWIVSTFTFASLIAAVASTRQQIQTLYLREGLTMPAAVVGVWDSIVAFFAGIYNSIFGQKKASV